MTRRLLTIGRFAQLTGLSVRALRLYDELGLLRPDTVDGSSGYRYYASDQFGRAELILRLRRLDVPLERIGLFLAAGDSGREAILHQHEQQLRERIDTARQALKATEELARELTMPAPAAPVPATPMERKTLPDQPVMRVRWTLPETPEEEYPLGRFFAEIGGVIERQGLRPAGPPYCICYPDGAEEGMVDGEAGIPVAAAGVAEGNVEPALLPGGEVASARYTGPSGATGDGTGRARDLWSQIEAADLVARGDPRWVFVSEPGVPPAGQVTELVWPLG